MPHARATARASRCCLDDHLPRPPASPPQGTSGDAHSRAAEVMEVLLDVVVDPPAPSASGDAAPAKPSKKKAAAAAAPAAAPYSPVAGAVAGAVALSPDEPSLLPTPPPPPPSAPLGGAGPGGAGGCGSGGGSSGSGPTPAPGDKVERKFSDGRTVGCLSMASHHLSPLHSGTSKSLSWLTLSNVP